MAAQLIAAYYEAFNRADHPAMLALLSDDVVHDVNQGAREVGRERFATFLARMDAHYRERITELVILADPTGQRFAAEFMVEGSYLRADAGFPAARGQRYRLAAGAFFAVEARRIHRVTTYYNLQDWLAQVSQAP